jgi:hypothetical protein
MNLNAVPLPMWVVYRQPNDFPQSWVVKEWKIIAGEVKRGHMRISDSLESVRKVIPAGLVRLPPMPGDDPKIFEVWM